MKEIDIEFDKYVDRILKIADRKFRATVLPTLRRKKISFTSGNGCWWLTKDGQDIHCSESMVPTVADGDESLRLVLDVCGTLIKGMDFNDLGSLMPNYNADTDTVAE